MNRFEVAINKHLQNAVDNIMKKVDEIELQKQTETDNINKTMLVSKQLAFTEAIVIIYDIQKKLL
ncbi:MAG: hypothetical protein WC389_17005 [Lutibacter sp.]|jgi:hypothetical protein